MIEMASRMEVVSNEEERNNCLAFREKGSTILISSGFGPDKIVLDRRPPNSSFRGSRFLDQINTVHPNIF